MNDKSETEIRSSTNQRTGCGGNLAKIWPMGDLLFTADGPVQIYTFIYFQV